MTESKPGDLPEGQGNPSDPVEQLSLKDQLKQTLEEARVVMPGMQALFGFQLIAVFNQTFPKQLSRGEQITHLCAIGLTLVAMSLAMTPAALHRQSEPSCVSKSLLVRCSKLLAYSLAPLAAALALDFYLLCRMILDQWQWALGLAAASFALLIGLWYVFPLIKRNSSPCPDGR